MKKFLIFAGLTLGLAASLPLVSAQQQQQQQTPPSGAQEQERTGPSGHRGRGRKHRGMGGKHAAGMKALRRLNLSETQQGQVRAIREATRQRTETQRRELHQLFQTRRSGGQLTAEQQARAEQLIAELRSTEKSAHQDILNVLTPEQRAQLEQFKQERKARRRGMPGGASENHEQP
jgi:Spy/CpxP family protein refolding chaperone